MLFFGIKTKGCHEEKTKSASAFGSFKPNNAFFIAFYRNSGFFRGSSDLPLKNRHVKKFKNAETPPRVQQLNRLITSLLSLI